MERGNDINDLIFGVLAQYGSVSFPSVGALRSVRVPASFTAGGTIESPRRIVEFSNEIGDDKSLPELIAERDSISLADATGRYDEWLASVSVRITDGVRYTIEGVGTLNLFAEGSAIFSMDPGLRTLLNPYGNDDRIAVPRHGTDRKRRNGRRKEGYAGKAHIGKDSASDRASHASAHVATSAHVSASAPQRYGMTVAMAVLAAVVCVLLISSVYFSPEGSRFMERLDLQSLRVLLDGVLTKTTEFIADICKGFGAC